MATIFWPRRTTRRRRMLRRTVHGNSIDLQSLVISVTIAFFSSTSFYVRRVGMDFFVLNRSWILSAVCSEQKPQFHFSSQYNTTQYNTIPMRTDETATISHDEEQNMVRRRRRQSRLSNYTVMPIAMATWFVVVHHRGTYEFE